MEDAGASERWIVRIVTRPIENEAISEVVDAGSGAIATFRGVVRARSGGREVVAIEYDCYREMAEKEMIGVLKEVAARYGLHSALVIHRTGTVSAGETSVLVAVAAAHRGPAFDAVRGIVDSLKERAPIWKKEHYRDGTSRWL